MLENWHQMVGNWLETIKTYIHCAYEILLLLWFSMKLGVINSFLIVCFTMVQNWKIFTKFLQKCHIMAIKQYLLKNVLHL